MQDYISNFNNLYNLLITTPKTLRQHKSIVDFLLQHSTVHLNVPRCTGKTMFIQSALKNGDTLVFKYPNSFPDALKDNKNTYWIDYILSGTFEPRMRGYKILPTRVLFLDDVTPTKELLLKLENVGIIDEETKIFSLNTLVD